MALSPEQRKIVYFSVIGPAILSIIGSVFIILIYFLNPALRKNTFQLVFILSIFDLMNAISFVIPTYDVTDTTWSCQAQAFLFNFSSAAGILWSTCMAIYLYLALAKFYILKQRGILISVVLTISYSSFSTLLNFGMNTYGRTESSCWVKEEYFGNRLGLFFFPLWIIFVLNSFIYARLRVKLKFDVNGQDKIRGKINRRLKMYPLILVACYLVYSVKAVMECFGVFVAEVEISSLAAVCRSLHGFLNCAAYGLTGSVKKIFKRGKSSDSISLPMINS